VNTHIVKAILAAGLIGAAGGCSTMVQGQSPVAASPAPVAPVDPYAAVRPATSSVGVVMPTLSDFPHPWDITTYVLRVTQFGVMPPLNGGVAFVGDSLTDSMRWNEMFPNIRSRNFGISGDTTVGLKARINQVVIAKPAKVILLIGTNDVEFSRYSVTEIVANIDDCIATLQKGVPGVKIVVEGLLPRQPQYDEKVRTVNALIKAAAEKRGLPYVDLYSHFVVNGRLDPSLTPDDIHISGQGYLIWRDLIRPYIENN
jgi:lysophospholipase L1-like esterase